MSRPAQLTRTDLADATVAQLAGEFDASNAGWVAGELRTMMADAASRRLILDLGGVTVLDSSTVSLVLDMKEECRRSNTAFALTAPDASRAARVLDLTGVGSVVPLTATVGEAITRLSEDGDPPPSDRP